MDYSTITTPNQETISIVLIPPDTRSEQKADSSSIPYDMPRSRHASMQRRQTMPVLPMVQCLSVNIQENVENTNTSRNHDTAALSSTASSDVSNKNKLLVKCERSDVIGTMADTKFQEPKPIIAPISIIPSSRPSLVEMQPDKETRTSQPDTSSLNVKSKPSLITQLFRKRSSSIRPGILSKLTKKWGFGNK
jgi:hypothetical protein